MVLTCVLTEHRPDGSTSARVWVVDPDTAARIAVALGEPETVQLLTPDLSAEASALADRAITLEPHTTS